MSVWLGAVLLAGLAATGASAASSQLPPLVQPATGQHQSGKIVWLDLVTPDLASEEQFYSGLFRWSFQDVQTGTRHYAIASIDGRPVAGLLQRELARGAQPAWLTFISVRDVNAVRSAVLSHGGKVLAGVHDYPRRGQQAVFADPQGAVFAVLDSQSGDPPDALAAPGEWIWSVLLCRDPAAEAGFYQTLFGYEVFDLPSDSAEHLVLSSQDFARAGVDGFAQDVNRRQPHWINFVRVADAAAAAAKAETLGGRVLVPPRPGRHGDRIAVIADPTGAPVGLMEWSGNDSPDASGATALPGGGAGGQGQGQTRGQPP